jgi:CHASE3 domain sensor protein
MRVWERPESTAPWPQEGSIKGSKKWYSLSIIYSLFFGCSLVVLWLLPKNNQRTTKEQAENKRVI